MAKKPNFLFIMTDQHCYHHLACHGDPVVKTPNIDRLSANGTSIDGMHTATPICMPNRQAFLTMRMNSVNGGHSNGTGLDLDNTTFPELLRAAGYHTALIGKSHLQNMTDEPAFLQPDPIPTGMTPPPPGLANASKRGESYAEAPYLQEQLRLWREPSFEPQTPYYGFDEVVLASGHGEIANFHHRRHLERLDPAVSDQTGRDKAIKVAPYNNQTYASQLAPEQYPTHFVGEQSCRWLERHVAGEEKRPFFLWCSFPDPHHPWTPPEKYYDMYEPADVVLPDSFYESPRTQTWGLRAAHRPGGVGKNKNRMPYFAAEAEARRIIATNYGMITFIDEMVGALLDKLEALGLAENTIVVFTSDHGDYMGQHGLFLKGPLHYQSLVKVPFIWCDPDEQYRQGAIKSLASYVDIGRTILERAGLWPFHGVQGRSLLPLLAGDTGQQRTRVLIEHMAFSPKFGIPIWAKVRTIVRANGRLTLYTHTDEGELYDLANDPEEMVNLWDSPLHANFKSDMLFHLAQEMADLADTARLAPTLA